MPITRPLLPEPASPPRQPRHRITRAASPTSDRGGAANPREAVSVDSIGTLMSVDIAEIDNARRLLAILGDPGRRTIIEHLSLRPETPGRGLPDIMGMDSANIYHRLRSLRYNKVVRCDKDHIYCVEPEPLRFLSRYFQVLTVASSLRSA